MDLRKVFIFVINCCIVWAEGESFNGELPDSLEYDLSVFLPNSQRLETVNFDPANGQPQVKGSINTYYPDTMTNLIVDYVADKKGYRASFHISKSLPPASAVSFETRLTASDLKGLAG